jgi:hypothetical protein
MAPKKTPEGRGQEMTVRFYAFKRNFEGRVKRGLLEKMRSWKLGAGKG